MVTTSLTLGRWYCTIIGIYYMSNSFLSAHSYFEQHGTHTLFSGNNIMRSISPVVIDFSSCIIIGPGKVY